jgi:hypothetical protein
MISTELYKGYLWADKRVLIHENLIGVYTCREPLDQLLLMGLSRAILTTMIKAPANISKFNDLKAPHYAFLHRQENINKLISIDLSDCMNHINGSRILSSLKFKNPNGLYFDLINQIMDLPIHDVHNDRYLPFLGITPIGEITNVVLHNFYENTLDSLLEGRYPGITYSRFGNELFILLKESDQFAIDEADIKGILDELALHNVDIKCSLRESAYLLPADNEEKALLLYEDGELEVWNYEDL